MTQNAVRIPGISHAIIDILAFNHHDNPVGHYMVNDSSRERLHWKNVTLMWIPCMLSNAISVYLKIVPVFLEALAYLALSLASFVSPNPNVHLLRHRVGYLTLDLLGSMGIDIIGIVAPYFAYTLDDSFVENFTKKHFYINNPYRQNRGEPASDRIEEDLEEAWEAAEKLAGGIGGGFTQGFREKLKKQQEEFEKKIREEFEKEWKKKFPQGIPNIGVGATADNEATDDNEAPEDLEKAYGVLALKKKANAAEAKNAYRKLAREWHPDKNPDKQEEAKKKFQEIGDAYEKVLKHILATEKSVT